MRGVSCPDGRWFSGCGSGAVLVQARCNHVATTEGEELRVARGRNSQQQVTKRNPEKKKYEQETVSQSAM